MHKSLDIPTNLWNGGESLSVFSAWTPQFWYIKLADFFSSLSFFFLVS